MGSAPVGAQYPLTSSLGEFLGYWDWLWYPGLSLVLGSIALPFAFHISMFSIHSSSQPLDFIRLFFTVAVSAPHHQPSSLFQTWYWNYGNWISEKAEIPWWWSNIGLLLHNLGSNLYIHYPARSVILQKYMDRMLIDLTP